MTIPTKLETARAAIADTTTIIGREHIARLAEADGEMIFAREVRAGCWDHRNDVAAAIAKAVQS